MPVFTPAVMAGTALAGGAIGAIGSIQQGQDTKKMYNYNASLADMQSKQVQAAADQEAALIGQNAVLNEYRQRKELAYATGRQVAGYAGSGVRADTGSPLKVMADDLSNAELEIAMGQWNAKADAIRTKNFARQQSSKLTSSANMMRKYGDSASRAGMFGAASSLLSSVGTGYNRLSTEKFGNKFIGEGI